jgi:hypothetical protein
MTRKKIGQPPVLHFSDNEPLQHFYIDGEGNEYSVAKLVDDTKHLPPFDCPLAALALDRKIWSGCDIYDLASHVSRCISADLTVPIILDWRGDIADGRHRVIKAIALGHRTILAVRMNWKPTPCRAAPVAA